MKDCCERAEILLQAYDETLAEYHAAESVIHSRAVSIDEAFIARGSVERAKARMLRVRNLYWTHVNEHGCRIASDIPG